MNYVSRDVTVIDLTSSPRERARDAALRTVPAPGTLADNIHIGKELYNTSVGTFDPAPRHHDADHRPHVEQRLGRPAPPATRSA